MDNRRSAGFGQWARGLWLLPLVLALAACGGGGSSSEPDAGAGHDPGQGQGPGQAPAPGQGDPPGGAPPAAPLPEAMRGQWEAILTYVPPFYSGPYGSVPEGDGSIGMSLFLWPDGRYQYDWSLARAYFGGMCFQTSQWQETGSVAGTGEQFTFTPGHASYMNSDSCGQFKWLDPAPVAPSTLPMRIDHDATGWPLLVIGPLGAEQVLEKCRRCQ